MVDIEKLIEWYLNSPIFNGEAYLSYYSSRERGPVYPEITAYAISLACTLYKRKQEEILLERAEKCTKYMVKINQQGAIPAYSDNLLYTFDTGIFVSSMFDLCSTSGKEAYAIQAEKSLRWILSQYDGEYFAAVQKSPVQKEWFHLPSVHLAKLAIPFLKASEYFSDSEYEQIAFRLLKTYTRLQLEEGNFQLSDEKSVTMTHPHCYATEAFLYAYWHSKKEEFFKIARKAVNWLIANQNKDGSFYRVYPTNKNSAESEKSKTTDAIAQATRFWKLLGVHSPGIEKAYNYLDNQMVDNGLQLLRPGSYGRSLASKMLNRKWRVFSWPTFFYLHSLTLPFGQMEHCKDLF